jgi:fumarate reductase (CoM/CoB) subunit A
VSAAERVTADVLVIGAGAAGVRAALEAGRTGVRALLVTKRRIGTAGASAWGGADAAGFGASGFVDPQDGPAIHEQDILTAAQGMADPVLARIVAADAPRQLLILQSLGVPFVRTGDRYLATRSCFSSRARSIKVKGHGRPIVECLQQHLLSLPNVNIMEETTVTDPLLDDHGRCVGALAIQGSGRPFRIAAGATILATGGAGRLFDANLNPPDVTGDGYAFGLRAGAELVNLEFMQAGFGVLAPRGPGIFQYWLWDLSPELISETGESFLGRHLPPGLSIEELMAAKARHFPFSVSDVSRFMEIGVQSFVNAERDSGREGSVWLRLSGIDARLRPLPDDHNLKRMWAMSREFLLSLGLDLDSPFRIAPCAHAMNGGLIIDQFGRTTVEGLYAAGEVASGPHGADRLGGNMFPTGQVFAERAGLHAAALTKDRPGRSDSASAVPTWVRAGSAAARSAPDDLSALRHELQRRASRALLVVREATPLRKFLAFIDDRETRFSVFATPDHAELRNLLLAGKAMATAALLREESRGGHYRKDFPEKREAWNRRVVLRLEPSGGIAVRLT